MRNLINLEGTIVPARQAYGEAFKYMGKKLTLGLAVFVAIRLVHGAIEDYRITHPSSFKK